MCADIPKRLTALYESLHRSPCSANVSTFHGPSRRHSGSRFASGAYLCLCVWCVCAEAPASASLCHSESDAADGLWLHRAEAPACASLFHKRVRTLPTDFLLADMAMSSSAPRLSLECGGFEFLLQDFTQGTSGPPSLDTKNEKQAGNRDMVGV